VESDPTNFESFKRLVEKHFAFLLAGGFRYLAEGSSDSPTLAVVMLAGRNVLTDALFQFAPRIVDDTEDFA
jgi:hypothetical protein